jgi:DNA-binding response OmpR family regulator
MNSAGSRKKILVVEDEPAISDLCRRVLTGQGFEVDIAANGLIAQDMIERNHYDLCLIDIRTPAMNGKELYQWLKEKHPPLADGVIFTTGDVMGKDTQSFLSQVSRPFLPKPFTPEELKAIMREALKKVKKGRTGKNSGC